MPPVGTNTCEFVFSSMALWQACLLLNSAMLPLAPHIWVALFALSQVREQGPLPLEEVT